MTDADLRETETAPLDDASLWQEDEYQAVSLLALLSIALALLSSVAVFWPTFRILWTIAPLAAVVSLFAMWRIAHFAPALIGRKAALMALALSITFSVAAPTRWALHRALVRRESRRFCETWLGFIRDDLPHKAHIFSVDPRKRRPLDDTLQDAYLGSSKLRKELDEFTNDPLIRPLLALGDRATVRHYETEIQETEWSRNMLSEVYAVSYEDEGKQKTFFLRIILERKYNPLNHQIHWMIIRANGGIVPLNYPNKPEPAQTRPAELGIEVNGNNETTP